MPASKISRLAKLRGHATGESHQAAIRAIESIASADHPILSEPVPQQEQLEGAVLNKLADLRWTSSTVGSPRFGIKRVIPAPNRLVIELERDSGIQEFVLNVMPVHRPSPDDPNPEVHGIPGLRVRPHDLGVSLFRPGLEGEVVVAGVTVIQWEAAHAAGFTVHHDLVGCAAMSSPAEWTQTERDYDSWLRDQFGDQSQRREADDNVLRSALLRRIGLINRLTPSSVNTWRRLARRGVVVEVSRPAYEPSSYEAFLEEMTSPRLSPQLTLTGLVTAEDQGNRTLRFAAPRSDGFLEIRLVG